MFAQEQAAAQFLQQSGGREATEEDMLQVEALIATIVADKVASVRMMSQQIMAGAQQEGPDPLLALKERELAIDEQKTLADIQNDQAKLQLEQEKLAERARQFSQRIQSQEKQTTQRIDASNMREDMRLRQKLSLIHISEPTRPY